MSNMNLKLEQMRDGLSAVSTAIQAIADKILKSLATLR